MRGVEEGGLSSGRERAVLNEAFSRSFEQLCAVGERREVTEIRLIAKCCRRRFRTRYAALTVATSVASRDANSSAAVSVSVSATVSATATVAVSVSVSASVCLSPAHN